MVVEHVGQLNEENEWNEFSLIVGVFLLNEYNLADKKALKLTDIVQLIQPTDVQV